MKKRFLSVGSCFVIGLTFTAVMVLFTTPIHAKTYHLTYSTFFPPTHIQAKLSQAWAKEIEKRSKGEIKIKIFTSGSLTPPPQAFDGTAKGITDFSLCVLAYSPGRFPVLAAADNPLGCPNAVVATGVINGLYEKFQPKEMSDVHVCYLFAHGPGLIHTTDRPVHKLEDLKGLKIRSTGTSQRIVRALGAAPVALSQGETYDALRKNVVNGTLVPMEALEGFKQAEVLKYTTLSYCVAFSQGFCVVMNLKKWNSLPENLQNIITEVNQEYRTLTARAWDESDASARKYAEKLGHEFITLSDGEAERFKTAVKPVLADYVKQANDQGVDGDAALKAAMELVKELTPPAQ